MRKLFLGALAGAAVSFAVVAATGLAGGAAKVINMQVGQVIYLKSNNFHCQALSKTQVACGANSIPDSVQVYFGPHQVEVLKFDPTGKKAAILLNVKR